MMYIHCILFTVGFCYHKIKVIVKYSTLQPKYLLCNGGSQCTDVLLIRHVAVKMSLSL